MRLFRLSTSPTLRVLDLLAVKYLNRRGNAVLSIEQALGARTLSKTLNEYLRKSGCLSNLRGKRPKAYKHLTRSLDAIWGLLRPGMAYHNPDGSRQTRVIS